MSENAENTNTQTPARTTAVRRTAVGTVVSNSMEKSISVMNERKVQHPKYKKYVKCTTKFLAHDEKNEANVGDKVLLMECRPLSKRKSWRLVKVLEKSKSVQTKAVVKS